jgi:acetyl esterase/lipase
MVKLKLDEPLAGVAVIAPWTSLHEVPDQNVNLTGDLITPYVAKPWSRAYLGSAKRDSYTDAVTAPSGWFENFPTRQILVLGGQNEILLPFIRDFAKKLKVSLHPCQSKG